MSCCSSQSCFLSSPTSSLNHTAAAGTLYRTSCNPPDALSGIGGRSIPAHILHTCQSACDMVPHSSSSTLSDTWAKKSIDTFVIRPGGFVTHCTVCEMQTHYITPGAEKSSNTSFAGPCGSVAAPRTVHRACHVTPSAKQFIIATVAFRSFPIAPIFAFTETFLLA